LEQAYRDNPKITNIAAVHPIDLHFSNCINLFYVNQRLTEQRWINRLCRSLHIYEESLRNSHISKQQIKNQAMT